MMTSAPGPRLNDSSVDGFPNTEITTISQDPNMPENPGSLEHPDYNEGSSNIVKSLSDTETAYEPLRINQQHTYINQPLEENSYQSLNVS